MKHYPRKFYGRPGWTVVYDPRRCGYEVPEPPHYLNTHQCRRKPGFGRDGLFCKQHAKVIAEREDRETT